MFEPSDELLYFTGTGLGVGEVEWDLASERARGSGEPLAGGCFIAVVQVDHLAEEAGIAEYAIAMVWVEDLPALASTSQRSDGDADLLRERDDCDPEEGT
mgnify:CR=1 FL=1